MSGRLAPPALVHRARALGPAASLAGALVLAGFPGALGFARAAAAKPAKATKAAAGAPTDTLPAIEAAAHRDSTNARTNYRLGIAYMDRDRPADAVRAFERAT